MTRPAFFILLIVLTVACILLPTPATVIAGTGDTMPAEPEALLEKAAALRAEDPAEAAALATRALELLAVRPDRRQELRAYKLLQYLHKKLGDFSTSIEFAGKRLLLAEELGDREAAASAQHNIGTCHRYLGAYGEALEHLNEAATIFEDLDDRRKLAISIKSIGIVYRQLGDYDRALDCYFKALGIEEEQGNTGGISRTLVNIGIIHKQTGEYERALDHYDRALAIVENPVWKWNIYNNKGNVYQNLENHQMALDYHRQALAGRQEIQDRMGIASSLLNIGVNHLHLDEPEKALDHIGRSMALSRDLGLKAMVATGHQTLSMVHRQMGRYDEALTEANQALVIAKKIEAREVIRDSLDELSKIHAELGNYEEALKSYHRFVETRDSLFSDEADGKLGYFQERYQAARREKEIALLRAGNESARADMVAARGALRRQEIIRNYLVVCFALLTLLAAVLYNRYRMRRQAHEASKSLNERIERQNIDLQRALDEIKALSGLLPICAHCKNIRDDQGYWQQIENFIAEHSEARFSHGICPDCIAKHYPQFLKARQHRRNAS